SSLWRDRYQAARLYWEIVESDALDHLTTGNDTKGKGASASLGRLAAYYPLAVRGDSWFWTLARSRERERACLRRRDVLPCDRGAQRSMDARARSIGTTGGIPFGDGDRWGCCRR